MSGTIVLDTPEQINMWVLLSRRSQLHLQMKGIKTPGIVKWCRENIPGCESARTAEACLIPLNDYIGELGGPEDARIQLQVLVKRGPYWTDQGVFANMHNVQVWAMADPARVAAYDAGNLVINRTLEAVRPADPSILMVSE